MSCRLTTTIVFLLIVIPVTLRCQILTTDTQAFNDGFVISFDTRFNINDILLGMQVGAWLAENTMSISGFFLVRPFEKTVRIKRSDNYYYQYREVRFGLGCHIEKQFQFRNIIFYIAGGPVLSFGDFKGSSRKPEGGLIPIIGAGIVNKFPKCSLITGYQYINLPRTSNHMVRVSLVYYITFQES